MAQNIHIPHYHQEGKKRKDNKELHSSRIGFLIVFVACLTKNEWLIGIAESLRNHRHNHCNLTCSTEDTQLCMRIIVLVDVWEDDITCRLIKNTSYTKEKNWPSIGQHLLCQRHIKQLTACKEAIF